jgi:hypothetical protein
MAGCFDHDIHVIAGNQRKPRIDKGGGVKPGVFPADGPAGAPRLIHVQIGDRSHLQSGNRGNL